MEDPNSSEEVPKKYGNYGVVCGGAILVHPIRPWWCLLEIYTVLVQIIFVTEYHRFNVWAVVIGVALGLLALLVTFKTTLTDPGICPKPTLEQARENEAEARRYVRNLGYPLNNRHSIHATKMVANPKYHALKYPKAERLIKLSFCPRCRMFKPPFTVHCYTCDCCVTHYDHHCPVFGGCIGQGNIRWFFAMVGILPIYWIYMLIVTSGSMFLNNDASEGSKITMASASYTLYFVVVGFMGSLVCPPFLAQFACLDRVHSRRQSRTRYVPLPYAGSNVSYPRNPQPLLPLVNPDTSKTDEPNANKTPACQTDDNLNRNVTLPGSDTPSDEIQEQTV